MLYRIVFFTIIIFLSLLKNVYANCNFNHYEYIDELNDVKFIKSINIDVNKQRKFYKNFLKISISKTKNIPKNLKKDFKANIIVNYDFGKCEYKGSIRQLGDWKDHINVKNGQPQMSLKVNLKEGNILKAVKFKLFIPETKEHFNEILGSIILRKFGFLSPETFETNLILNGSKSKVIFQEEATKEFLERNFKREGPIFEGDESLLFTHIDNNNQFKLENISLSKLINHKWFLSGKNSEYITLNALNKLQESYLFYTSNFPNSQYSILPNLPGDKIFENYYFLLMSMNGWHALRPHNRKFYYNSFINKFEPIYYDGMFRLDTPIWVDLKDDINMFDKDFSFNEINQLLKDDFKNEILDDFKKRVLNFDKKLDTFFLASVKMILSNSKVLQKKIDIDADYQLRKYDKKKLIDNYIHRVEKSLINQRNVTSIISNKEGYDLYLDYKEKITLSSNEVAKLLNKNSLQKERFVILQISNNINFKTIKNEFNIDNYLNGNIVYSKGVTYDLDKLNKTIDIKQTNADDWILFKNINFDNWTINFLGKIKNLNNSKTLQRVNKHGLTGCLNFYKSSFDQTIINSNNGLCEDSINIVNSFGSIKSISVENAFSDGVDVDFSNLIIKNLNVLYAGNDCLDLSAGTYEVLTANLSGCNDKGLSIGENSLFTGKNIIIKDSNIGVSTKDFSKSFINVYQTSGVNICAEATQKKQEFGGSFSYFINKDCNGIYKKDLNSIIQ